MNKLECFIIFLLLSASVFATQSSLAEDESASLIALHDEKTELVSFIESTVTYV